MDSLWSFATNLLVLCSAVHRQTEKRVDTFITRSSSSKQEPGNTNPQIDKSDDESDSEATATMNKRQNCSDNASQAKKIVGRLYWQKTFLNHWMIL